MLQFTEDGTTDCWCRTMLLTKGCLQGQRSDFNHADMYLTEFVASLSQIFPLKTCFQGVHGVSRHDGLITSFYGDGGELYHFLNLRGAITHLLALMQDSQHIHQIFAEDEEG